MSRSLPGGYQHVVVVVPAHNEADHLPDCLRALLTAAACAPVPVTVVVVLDRCDDGSAEVLAAFGSSVEVVAVDAGNVGTARAAGFAHARGLCQVAEPAWYATTDADTVVDPDWLVRQLAADADMVLGVVRVSDWRRMPLRAVRHYLDRYHAYRDHREHNHVHGANMGLRADAYWAVGGFRTLPTGEDVDLVDRCESAGYRIRRDARLSVTTSARRKGRAPNGFAQHLRDLAGSGERAKDPA